MTSGRQVQPRTFAALAPARCKDTANLRYHGAVVRRSILHVDMDAFYASIEERDRPELAGQAVIVGGTPQGRGVVAAANYVARTYGIRSAMPAARARRLCPHAVFLPARHHYYGEVSQQIRAIFRRYTPLVEPLSLDEAFLDVTDSRMLFGSAPAIGRMIKRDVTAELHLSASVGVASNKFLAKIASDLEKPDGLVVVDPNAVQAFLDPLPVTRLWGVGAVAAKRLRERGVTTIAELRARPQSWLLEMFGRHGQHLGCLVHGIDDRPVTPESEAKSISHETTFDTDITDLETLRAWLSELTEQVGVRLRRRGLYGRTVQLKIRFADFRTITRAQTMREPSNVTRSLWHAAAGLLQRNLPDVNPGVRLLGVGVSGFEGAPLQAALFGQASREKDERLDAVSDSVKVRFGASALRRATDLRRSR